MKAPILRLSSTGRRGNSRRFSGTCAIPRLTMRCSGVLRISTPSMEIAPARGRIRPEITRINGAFPAPWGRSTPTAHRLAGPDFEADAEQRLEGAVARFDRFHLEHA